jgi:DNA polymerase III epsilon subunit-like protein
MRDESWLVVDTETDGFSEPVHVVEIAAQRMRGWQRDGEAFRVLLNHDVPIDPMAEALHGYSREYLRVYGQEPETAHGRWREYAADQPIVAYNISFDWNRALEPEYARLGLPPAGRRGFCAMTLARRIITGTENFKLETLKEHFTLSIDRSHYGRNDVFTLVALIERILAPKLYKAGIVGFDTVAEFSRRTPLAICREQINGVGDPVWFIADCGGQAQGPFPPSSIREMCNAGPLYVWREGMPEWRLSSELPDFAPVEKKSRKRASRPKRAKAAELIDESELPDEGISEITRSLAVTIGLDRIPVEASPGRTSRRTSAAKALTRSYWTDELIGLCKGILADGEVNTKELVGLQNWLMGCPCTDIYPISAVAEIVEAIVADGVITGDELEQLKQAMEQILPI